MAPRAGQDYMRDYWQVHKNATVAFFKALVPSASGPIVTVVTGYGPAWPGKTQLTIITMIFVLVTTALAFALLDRLGRTWCLVVMIVSAVVLVPAFIWYSTLTVRYVYGTPDWLTTVIIGTNYLPEVAEIVETERWGPEDALKAFEHNPEKVWQRDGINRNKLSFLYAWVLFFISFESVLVSFVMDQRLRVKEPRVAAGAPKR